MRGRISVFAEGILRFAQQCYPPKLPRRLAKPNQWTAASPAEILGFGIIKVKESRSLCPPLFADGLFFAVFGKDRVRKVL